VKPEDDIMLLSTGGKVVRTRAGEVPERGRNTVGNILIRMPDDTLAAAPGPRDPAGGGEIAIVRTGDPIEIDIPNRSIRLLVDEREIAARKAAVKRYAPAARERRVPTSLRAYALLVSSADKGAVRLIDTPDNA